MASAIQRVRPDVKFAIGPAIEDGFYYDIDTQPPLTDEDLAAIEREMARVVQEDLPFVRKEMGKADAIAYFGEKGETYKVELLEDLEDGTITFYEDGDFSSRSVPGTPICPPPGGIKAFKLLSVAGGVLARRLGSPPCSSASTAPAFPKKKALDEHLTLLAEAEKTRPTRKLGKQLDLFSFHDQGPGFPFFHPKGMVVLNEMLDFWREEHRKRGYGELRTRPSSSIAASGNSPDTGTTTKRTCTSRKSTSEPLPSKPMNCPGGMLVYKNQMHSYRDLPLRWAELGTVHRHEKSGVLLTDCPACGCSPRTTPTSS